MTHLTSAWRTILPWYCCSSKTTQNTSAAVSVQTIPKKFHNKEIPQPAATWPALPGHEPFWSPFLSHCCSEAAMPKAWCQSPFLTNSEGHPFLLTHTGNHILDSFAIYILKKHVHSHLWQRSITTGKNRAISRPRHAQNFLPSSCIVCRWSKISKCSCLSYFQCIQHCWLLKSLLHCWILPGSCILLSSLVTQ